jgi:solute carrier family 34 (sodium-dependent phosphate cotransporter)
MVDNSAYLRESEEILKSNLKKSTEHLNLKQQLPQQHVSISSVVNTINTPPNDDPEEHEHKKQLAEEQIKHDKKIERSWSAYSFEEKAKYAIKSILKVVGFFSLLYLFLLALSFMTVGFTLVSGHTISAAPTIKFLFSNPFAAFAFGIIATAIMQNATATSSIVVTLVGTGIIADVKTAIPMIMGATIGTCATNSFVAMTLSNDVHEFKRAFSGATCNDMFNLLTAAVLLPVEIVSGLLYRLTDLIVEAIPFENSNIISQINIINQMLSPVVNLFIVLDMDAVKLVREGYPLTRIALRCCQKEARKLLRNSTESNWTEWLGEKANENFSFSISLEQNDNQINASGGYYVNEEVCVRECNYWCKPMLKAFGDGGTGLFWIILSIVVLIACLFSIVKVLSMLISGPIAKGVRHAINANLPGFRPLTKVALFFAALAATLVMQDSDIVTATLVPLCGIGIVTLERIYVMTLAANIGTTVTGILVAFTQPPFAIRHAMQLALIYTLYATFGVLLWLPLSFMRMIPLSLAKTLSNIVFNYRWFLYVYIILIYLLGPLVMFGLALVPYWIGLAVFGIPLLIFLIGLILIRTLQTKAPSLLPERLKDFKWLPVWMRSLEPYDKKMKNMKICKCKRKKKIAHLTIEKEVTNTGAVLEVPVIEVEEVEEDVGIEIPNLIRRMNTIEGLVDEARAFSRLNSLSNFSIEKIEEKIKEEKQEEQDEEDNNKQDNNEQEDDDQFNYITIL